jgi:magnesium chelatase subunit D
MSSDGLESMARADANRVTELFAVDPIGLGGIVLRAGPGPQRDQVCSRVRELLPGDRPFSRVPLHITDDRLLGGLSLAATLRGGRVVVEPGILASSHGGVVVLAMAERLEPRVASQVCAALDRGEFSLERDGIAATVPCRIGVIALDEGLGDESAPTSLIDRLAFRVDLSALDPRLACVDPVRTEEVERGRDLLPDVVIGDEWIEALCQTALALGIASLRAPLWAVLAARANAAIEGRLRVSEEDAVTAGRLVLGPRATCVPASETETADESDSDDDATDRSASGEWSTSQGERDNRQGELDADQASEISSDELGDVVLAAAKSGIPKGLLDQLATARDIRRAPSSTGRSGSKRASRQGGRPAGTRAAEPRSGERLNVIETLRAAAPWQPLRQKKLKARASHFRRIEIRREDFRVTWFIQRTETRVIFSVDASGSLASQRLAEAKGAIEQVLIDCYARRDQVALVAFRGTTAVLLLQPTRSLARVRRSLADLAGGGATPLAAGIDAALALAIDARKQGQTPLMVLMTDGRANVGKDEKPGAATAAMDALKSARAVRAADIRCLFLDTAPRPRTQARDLAAQMGARYLPLPYLDAAGISRHVRSLAQGAS